MLPLWFSHTNTRVIQQPKGNCYRRLQSKPWKSTYHGFLKMTVHMVWNKALRERKHPAKIYI